MGAPKMARPPEKWNGRFMMYGRNQEQQQ